MLIVALDLGTTTGCAVHDGVDVVRSGVWRLQKANPPLAYAEMRTMLEVFIAKGADLIAYEAVPGNIHNSGDSAHRWGGFEAILLAECVATQTRYLPVNPATWKSAAGLGPGTRERHALKAARARWPGHKFETPDEAVARWVAMAAAERVTRADRASPRPAPATAARRSSRP